MFPIFLKINIYFFIYKSVYFLLFWTGKNTFHILTPYFFQNNFRISVSPKWTLSDLAFQGISLLFYAFYILRLSLILILNIDPNNFTCSANFETEQYSVLFPTKATRYLNFVTTCIILKCTWKYNLNSCDLESCG
jgi:hypothetical protein